MENSRKQEFTRRLCQCNRGELITIMYDIIFAYLDDAKEAKACGEYDKYKAAVRNAQNFVGSLKTSLDFKYEISRQLYPLYVYCGNCLEKSVYQNRTDGITDAEKVLKKLYAAFCEAAKTDTSEPLMRNTQQVYAGITYGKNVLNENFIEDDHRGFFA